MNKREKTPEGSGEMPDLNLFQPGSGSSGITGMTEIEKLRKHVALAEHDPAKEQILADWLSKRNFTIEKNRGRYKRLMAKANSTGTEKPVLDWVIDILDETEKQIQN